MPTKSSKSGGATDTQPKQDTPGRAKPSSSRQQTDPDQVTQTGSPAIDKASAREARKDKDDEEDAQYRDRPTDDGKHGDGHQEPNAGFPSRSG